MSVSADGHLRILLRDARLPAIAAPAPYAMKQKLRLPEGGRLRVAFGAARSSWDKSGGGILFSVRMRSDDGTVTLLSEEVKRWRGEDDTNWVPVVLHLPPSGEGEVEIELATEPVGPAREGEPEDFIAAHAVWLDPAIFVPARAPRPNIVVVIIDALRPDHLGCYGYDRSTSPFLDSFAAQGIVFEDASAQATWTMPSIQSLLTSTYRFLCGARVGKITIPGEDEEELFLQPVSMPVSLQGELRAAGYESLACVGGGFLDPALGFDAGFDWYWSPKHKPMLPNQLAVVKERLSGGSDRPFFLLLHTHEVHNYFQGWAHRIEEFDRGYLGPLTDPRLLMDAALRGDPDELPPADLQYIVDLYDGEILHTDRYLRLFFDWLLSQPWGANTLIVITADHGQGLGGHGVMSHGGVPYQSLARVPLIVRVPGVLPRAAPRRVRQPVALVDLMPSLLDAAGAEPPASCVGRSLMPVLAGAPLEDRPVFSESAGAGVMARKGDWCYISSRGEQDEELYDLSSDPGQTRSIAESSPEQLDEMRHVLADLAMRAARGYRLAVVGPRTQQLTIELTSNAPLAYLDMPTALDRDAISVAHKPAAQPGQPGGSAAAHRASIRLPPGDTPQVVLFDPDDPQGTITVAVRSDQGAVGADKFHLGERGQQPAALPLVIGRAAEALLAAGEPPVAADADEFAIWVWLPPGASQAGAAQQLPAGELPEELTEHLRSLGYLR
jgi:hypothetical protein